mgnify:CR=1 FL=1
MSLQDSKSGSFSRRRLFGAVGAGAALVGAGAVGGYAAGNSSPDAVSDVVDFRGDPQAGIVTPAQDRMHFVAFDITTDSREEFVALLREWTEMAERLHKDSVVPSLCELLLKNARPLV